MKVRNLKRRLRVFTITFGCHIKRAGEPWKFHSQTVSRMNPRGMAARISLPGGEYLISAPTLQVAQ